MKRGQTNNLRVTNSDGHVIGLDIGATGVRATVLTQHTGADGGYVTLHGAAHADLPVGVVVNGVVQEPAEITAVLRGMWAEHSFECRHVVLGTASHQVLVRALTMPDVTAEQRAKMLPFQAKETVALPVEDLVLDFCALGDPDPLDGQVHGLLVATPRQPILSAVEAVEKANLTVARVDLSSFGVLRAMADQSLDVEAVIDLGAHLTTIVIHQHGVPKLVRTLVRGAAELTEQVADRLSVTPIEAERIKRDGGLKHDDDEVVRALTEGLRPLVAEIRTSIGYFRRSQEDAVIQRVSLTGGGARLTGLAGALGVQLSMPVEMVTSLANVNPSADATLQGLVHTDSAPSAVSVGLAMGVAA